MDVLADESCWVQVKDGTGAVLLSRNLAAQERINVQGVAPMQLVVGNAARARVWVRGQPLDLQALARDNVVRTEVK